MTMFNPNSSPPLPYKPLFESYICTVLYMVPCKYCTLYEMLIQGIRRL